ncbi:DUF742 domain-containing protein [Spongiactinospora sp. TRM90649]|uniref:DUF742 domain-containing protein n=1 Tax=Spongiactinospora sp. TRM90649 TaxID=3031114 RepID=UPI0023F89E6A|nr:DUF742 domain-containing protein [Spongiactinospora sp. TRM90649]MDF5754992.1 DUF742 domain-containing protein [Spongiactinospora sp. TRM90649]
MTGRRFDQEAPVVRPYTMTRGRTRPTGPDFDLIAIATAVPAALIGGIRNDAHHTPRPPCPPPASPHAPSGPNGRQAAAAPGSAVSGPHGTGAGHEAVAEPRPTVQEQRADLRAKDRAHLVGLAPEHLRVLAACRAPASVAEIASETGFGVMVTRVLLGDLRERGLITLRPPATMARLPQEPLLRAVLHGLRAL